MCVYCVENVIMLMGNQSKYKHREAMQTMKQTSQSQNIDYFYGFVSQKLVLTKIMYGFK